MGKQAVDIFNTYPEKATLLRTAATKLYQAAAETQKNPNKALIDALNKEAIKLVYQAINN